MNAMKHYHAGIDVGINSVGFAAIEVDSKGLPLNILNNMVVLHDSGVDPGTAKTGATRLANSGTARRTRKLIARRRKRLQKLDRYIEVQGWPLVDFSSLPDPYTPWKIRAKLTQDRLEGEEQGRGLSIALRHMARHRGWRNPYEGVESLHSPKEASKQFKDLKDRVTKVSGVIFDEDATPAEVVCDIGLSPKQRLRSAPSAKYKEGATLADEPVGGKSKEGLLGGKLMQSDNANELRKIGIVQGLSNEKVNEIIDQVFASESPKGQAGKRAKKDELPGQEQYVRALRAHLAFQRFRIVAAVANLRILEAEPKHERLLSQSEKDKVIEFLMSADGDDGVTWSDVAEELGIERECLSGTAKRGADGERPSSFPPTNSTNISIVRSKVKPLIEWWRKASDDEQAALVTALSNADELTDDQPSAETVRQFLSSLDEQSQEKIDKISLPKGRAAYSVNSLERLTRRMLKDSVDLFEARKREFGVDNNWTPTPDSIGEPVGNPAVDRVLKIVNRWLLAVTRKWGPPKVVNIEHVRVGFTSAAQTRKYEEENKTNRERNLAILEELRDKYKGLADEYAKQQDQLNAEGDKLAAEAMAAQAAAEEKLRQQQASQPQSQPQSKPSGGGSSTPARPSTPAASSGGYQWPVSGGTITSPFGWRVHPIFHTKKYHDGVDVSGLPTGTPIRSIANGYVTKASYYGGYGNCVMISIGNGYTTLYGHMSRFAVSNGQYVTKGQVVGYIGSTGWSTGPHLHFSLIKNGRYINPMSIF